MQFHTLKCAKSVHFKSVKSGPVDDFIVDCPGYFINHRPLESFLANFSVFSVYTFKKIKAKSLQWSLEKIMEKMTSYTAGILR